MESLIQVEHQDPDMAMYGRALNIMLLSFWGLLVAILLIFLTYSLTHPGEEIGIPMAVNFLFMLIILITTYSICISGRVRLAVWVFLLTLIFGTTFALVARGFTNTIILVYSFTVVASGFIIGKKGSMIFAVLSILSYSFAAWYVKANGTVFPPDCGMTQLNNYMALAASLIVMAIITWVFTENLRDHIAKLKRREEEKEMLMKEIHHRVKNNLQIISSILNLQMDTVKEKESREAIRDSVARVKTMALIHERLYMSRDLSSIGMRNYVDKLLMQFNQSAGGSLPAINQDIQGIELDVDRALSLGLIINELVTNSVKHGFPESHDAGGPAINISLKEKDGDCLLVVEDNGVGLPEGFDMEKTESLGLQLVTTLAEEMGASIEIGPGQGAVFILTFNCRRQE